MIEMVKFNKYDEIIDEDSDNENDRIDYFDRVPPSVPEPFDNETLNRFRWGFTAAACFIFFIWIVFSTWNTIIGGLFLVVSYCYIPAILYVSLTDNSFISKKLSEKVLYFPVIKITFFIEIILIILVIISPILLIFLPVLSYFLSRKIYKISVLKQYNLFINIFKDGFYKLRIGFLIIILFFLLGWILGFIYFN